MNPDDLYPCTIDRLDREARARLNDTKPEPTPYDVLIDCDNPGSYGHNAALREAVDLCRQCPLATAAACFKANADERWVKAIKSAKKPPTKGPHCGKKRGSSWHSRNGEFHCEECKEYNREAWRRDSAVRRAKKRAERDGVAA